MSRTVNLAIDCETDNEIAKAFEVLGRIAGGLVIDGMEARIYAYNIDDEDEDRP